MEERIVSAANKVTYTRYGEVNKIVPVFDTVMIYFGK